MLGKSIGCPGDLVSLESNVVSRIDAESQKLFGKVEASGLRLEGRMNTQTLMLGSLIALNAAIVLKLFLL